MAPPDVPADVVIVGGGPAGLGAATCLCSLTGGRVVVLDREDEPGGLPAHSPHPGFGLARFKVPLPGPTYAARLVQRAERAGVEIHTRTTVLEVAPDRAVLAAGPDGLVRYRARAVVLATGCRESPRPRRVAPGPRPAGVYNTAVIHRLLHTLGERPGRRAVVVGSEDVGLMAVRLLRRAGTEVVAVVEELPYRLGYYATYLYSVAAVRVPLWLHHRVTEIRGTRRVEGVEVVNIPTGARRIVECDTVVFSGRFLPEASLARSAGTHIDERTGGPSVDQHYRTSVRGIFACGNVLHGAESSDVALAEGERTARSVAAHLAGQLPDDPAMTVTCGPRVAMVVPQRLVPAPSPWVLLVRPDAPVLWPTLSLRAPDGSAHRMWKPWAMPHRSLKMTLPSVSTASGGTVQVEVTGSVRGPAFHGLGPLPWQADGG